MKIKETAVFFVCAIMLLSLIGCEAFTRKFTRKSKKSDQPVEMVLVPEEYKGPNMTKEELYRQYFTYWKAWQDELINALTYKASVKKKVDCGQEAVKNMVNMKGLLVEDAQRNIDPYIKKLVDLTADIRSDLYGSNDSRNLKSAENMKIKIQAAFVYPKVRNYLR